MVLLVLVEMVAVVLVFLLMVQEILLQLLELPTRVVAQVVEQALDQVAVQESLLFDTQSN
jgi:hypothetical protein